MRTKRKRIRTPDDRDYGYEWPEGLQLNYVCSFLSPDARDNPPLVITAENLRSLNSGEFLDDVAMDIAFDTCVWCAIENRSEIAIMHTHFLDMVASGASRVMDQGDQMSKMLDAIRRPFRGDKSIVLVPIVGNNHYSVAAFFVIESGDVAMVIHLDSLSIAHGGHDADEYLSDIWSVIGQAPQKSVRANGVPQQPNLIDCGAYAIVASKKLIDEASGWRTSDHDYLDTFKVICRMREKERKEFVSAEHAAGWIKHPRFMTKKWFTHSDTLRIRETVAEDLLAIARISAINE